MYKFITLIIFFSFFGFGGDIVEKKEQKLLLKYNQNYKKAKNNKQYQKAIDYLLEIIHIEKKYSKDNMNIATKYNDIAGLYKKTGQYKIALKFYQKDLNLTESTVGKYDVSTAISYQSMGNIYRALKKYKKSLHFFQEAIAIIENLFGENHPFSAIIHDKMANIYNVMGEYSKTLAFYNKALTIKIYNKNYLSMATSHNNIGLLYKNMGEYKKSLLHIKKALKISTHILGKNHLYIAKIYNNLGLIYTTNLEYDKALKTFQKSIKIKEKTLISTHYSFATIYNNIADTHYAINNYPKALEYYTKALKISKLHSSVNANIYNNIAATYKSMGNYDKALGYYSKALLINKNSSNKNSFFIPTLYNNIANIYTDIGEYEKALEHYRYILKSLPNNHVKIADLYNNIALLYSYIKNYTNALEYYKKALNLKEKQLDKNHPSIATILNNIGLTYKSKGEYVKALNFMQKSLTIKRKVFTKDHSTFSISYNSLSVVYSLMKNYDKAYYNNNKAFQIFLKNRNKNFMILNLEEKENYLKDNISLINKLLFSGHKFTNKLIKNKILNSWLNYKGTLFEYQNILSMLKNNPKTPTKIIDSINELNFLNSQLSHTENQEKEKSLNEKIHTIEIKLSKENDSLKSILKLNEINSTQIASYLKPHQLYIDFAQGDKNYYLFTIDHKNHISFQEIDENTTKQINQNIRAFRANTQKMADYLQEGKVEVIKEQSKEQAKEILTQLYNDIISKYLQKALKNKTHLIISPDGLLNYLPFEALYSKIYYLIEKYQINYISSGKELIRQTKIAIKNPKYSMVLFANANFDANERTLAPIFGDDKCIDEPERKKETHTEFTSLGGNEIKIITKYYPHAIIFNDENATIKNLMHVPSSTILHLSTHGLLLESREILNPMRKSILIFAGANKNKKQAIISALQLSTLNLKDTQLVVLSACQSGLGEIHNAEGVVGLPKALLQAGAKNVIMSLWTVSNRKTAMLMDNFYANISDKQDYSTALQNAKIKMIEKHPYYWSAFILSGF